MLYYLEKETSEFYNKNAEKFESPKNEKLKCLNINNIEKLNHSISKRKKDNREFL